MNARHPVVLTARAEESHEERAWPHYLLQDRRGFLTRLLGLGAGIAVGGTGLLVSEDAYAGDEVPPGIKEAARRDPAIETAYRYWRYPQWLTTYNSDSSDIVQYVLRGYNPTGKFVDPRVLPETPYIEPAYWFLIIASRSNSGEIGKNLKNRNLPLDYFADGLINYFVAWVRGYENRDYFHQVFTERVEDLLLKALFTATSRNESEVEAYKNLDLPAKEKKLQEVMGSFEAIGKRMETGRAAEMVAAETAAKSAIAREKLFILERKKLEKEIFILEKRLQREKLSYETEYELTKKLQAAKGRFNNPSQAESTERKPQKSRGDHGPDDYSKLLIAAWSTFILVYNYWHLSKKEGDLNYQQMQLVHSIIQKPLREIDKNLNISGPPFYYAKDRYITSWTKIF